MAIHSKFLAAVGKFSFNFQGGYAMSVEDVRDMSSNAIRLVARSVGVPRSDKPEDLMRWVESHKNRRSGLYEFMSDPYNFQAIEEYLSITANELLNHPSFEDLRVKAKKESNTRFFEQYFTKLRVAMNTAVKNTAKSYEKYFKLFEKYQNLPQKVKVEIVRKRKFTKTLDTFFSNSPMEMRNKLLNLLGAINEDQIQRIKLGYGMGIAKDVEDKVKDDKEMISAVLKKLGDGSIPKPLVDLVTASSKSEMTDRLNQILNGISPNVSRKVFKVISETVNALNSVRNRVGKIQDLREIVSENATAATRAYHIRNASTLADLMVPLLKAGNKDDLKALIDTRVGKNKRGQMAKDLKRISPALEKAFLAITVRGGIQDVGVFQKALTDENNQKKLRNFVRDEDQILAAIKNKGKLQRMKALGFKPKQYFKSVAGKTLLFEIVEKLMDEKSILANKVSTDKATAEFIQKAKQNPSAFELARFIAAQTKEAVEDQRHDIQKRIRTMYGDSLIQELGKKDFEALVRRTVDTYYTSSVTSSIQGFVYNQKEKLLEQDFNKVDLQKIPRFARYARGVGVTTLNSLGVEISKELRQMANKGARKDSVLRFADWILSLRGNDRLNHIGVVKMVENIMDENDEMIRLYWKGKDAEVHAGDREYGAYLERQRREGADYSPTEKKKRVHRYGKREIDPDKKRRDEERKFLRDTMKILETQNPEIAKVLRLKLTTLDEKGFEYNTLMREAQRVLAVQMGKNKSIFLKAKDASKYFMGENPLRPIMGGEYYEAPMAGEFKKDEMKKINQEFAMVFRGIINKVVKQHPEYRIAKRAAKLQMYGQRYEALQGLFQDQFRLGTPARNTGLYSEIQRQEELNVQGEKDPNLRMAEDPTKLNEMGMGIAGNKDMYPYVYRNVYRTIPAMIENAKSIEELEEVQRYVDNIIPAKYLGKIEKMYEGPGYVMRKDSLPGQEPFQETSTGSLRTFMNFHRSRINERMGNMNTPGNMI